MNKQKAIIFNKQKENNYYKITIKPINKITFSPGQFLNIFVKEHFLGLPYAFFKEEGNDMFSILVKPFGKGSEILANSHVNDEIAILGPLGKSAPLISKKKIYLAGAGIGIASIWELANALSKDNEITCVLGFKYINDIGFINEFKKYFNTKVVCEEKSPIIDFHGNIIQFLEKNIIKYNYVYFCGGKNICKIFDQKMQEHNKDGVIIYENNMACGIGICNGCNVDTKNGDKKVCQNLNFFIGEIQY